MLKDSKKLILGLFGLLSLVLLLAGAYAFFSSASLGDKIARITTNGVTFSYKEGTNSIRLNNAMPMTDDEGKNQDTYFEFDITANTPKNINVPYYITARKGSNSSNIDDAIKLYLTKAIRTNKDIYNIHTIYTNVNLNLCDGTWGFDNEQFKINCTKTYSRGDAISGYLASFIADFEYDTLEECQNNELFTETVMQNYGTECLAHNDKYIMKGYFAYYDDLATCQTEISGEENAECVYKETLPIDLYHNDVYFTDNSFDTMVACNNYYNNNSNYNYNIIGYDLNYSTTCALTNASGDIVAEQSILLANYSELNQFSHNSIDVSKYTEKLLYDDAVPFNSTNYRETYRLRTWIDYDTDFSIAKYNDATFSLTINVYSHGSEKQRLAAGLYDDNDNLIETYEDLVSLYGLDVTAAMPECYQLQNDEWECYDPETRQAYSHATSEEISNRSLSRILLDNKYSNVTKFVLPNNIETIGNNAFLDCINLKSIELPTRLKTIGVNAFYNCRSLTSIDLPNTVTSIGEGAFMDCDTLTSITIPSGVTTISESLFNWCDNLEHVELPDTITTIGDVAFKDCRKLTNIDLPSNLVTIGENAFFHCSSLTAIEIPASVTTIGEYAFNWSENLTTVTLEANSNLATIGAGAFNNTTWYLNESQNFTVPVYLNGILVECVQESAS